MSDITLQQKEERYLNLQRRVAKTFTKHNDVSYSLFNTISKFSSILPDNLNNLVGLSDMITDAIVISGRSSLSKSIFQIPIISNTLNLNRETSTLTLNYKTEREYSVNIKKSYIQTSNKFSIFDKSKTTLSSFESLLRGSPILIETNEQYFKYTLALTLESKVHVSCIDLQLGLNTSSYPLISELYYINENNKKVYCTILNNSDTKLDLDADRQKDNKYTIFLPNVKTNRLYITLEDKGKADLIIDSLSIKKLAYEKEGEITLGPITSTSPILKATVAAIGDTEYSNFYLSPDMDNWYELALPTDVPFNKDISKILAFNTVSIQSLKSDKDFKEFYLKIYLKRRVAEEATESQQVFKQDLSLSSLNIIPQDATNVVVYKHTKPIFYGSDTYKKTDVSSNVLSPHFVKVNKQGEVLVKGFVTTPYSLVSTTQILDSSITTKALRVGADSIDSSNIDPNSANIYGYSVTTKNQTLNTKLTEDVVFLLKPAYPKDIYTITQDDKQIQIDLSLGYIRDGVEVLVFVEEDKEVVLLDSTSKVIKKLTQKPYKDSWYVSLLEEEIFDIPVSLDSLILNTLYPIRLNTDFDFSLTENRIETKNHIVNFNNLARLSTELIDFEINLSKENGTKLQITDLNLKNKYTEFSTEHIKAYGDSRVIKLKNKFIKKGSLVLSIYADD